MFALEKLKNISKTLLKPVIKNSRFFTVTYIVGLITVIFVLDHGKRHISVFELLFEVYLLCVVINLLPRRLGNTIKAMIYFLAYSLGITDMFVYLLLGAPFGPDFLRIVLQTNSSEASEAISSYLTWQSLLSPILLFFAVLIIHVASYFYKKRIVLPQNIKRTVLWCFPPLLLFSMLIGSRNEWYIINNLLLTRSGNDMEKKGILPHDGGLYLPVYRFIYSVRAMNIEARQIDTLKENAKKVKVGKCAYTVPDIVFIIGESYNRSHSSLYGYPLKTTPRQEALAKSGNLIWFTDVISPDNFTSQVFRVAFSLYANGCKGEWTDYPLFTQLFKQSGYNVTFITNQFIVNPGNDIHDMLGGQFINDPYLNDCQFSRRNKKKHKSDLDLIADYDSLKRFETRHNLTIFHFIGQHAAYDIRYPAEFRRFTAKDYKRNELKDEDIENLAHYDNSIYYNDFVVTEIVKLFAGRDAIVIYMPDHGEIVYDYGAKFGHAMAVKSKEEIIPQFDIPFWIWVSPMFKERHNDIYERIKKVRNMPFMTDNIDQMLIYLGGISTEYYRPTDNPLDNSYNVKRKRMIKDSIDYDVITGKKTRSQTKK
ncbi:phosphoethanolamine transferase [Prevotella sp. OH937_COT-195]|uniref:phosphoethanolamine transferase n=1 Tax=Prevotella sp. OH937_COT-195 TaxID=2491051 RepID=UPI000F651A51|nr:phosphoethanolamine transferase [Prevotella sp. OH937_COT-195]RRD02377.1 phosphoethanolamine transferase [Prevotella sp. OH937_COT-195]